MSFPWLPGVPQQYVIAIAQSCIQSHRHERRLRPVDLNAQYCAVWLDRAITTLRGRQRRGEQILALYNMHYNRAQTQQSRDNAWEQLQMHHDYMNSLHAMLQILNQLRRLYRMFFNLIVSMGA